VVDTSRSYLDIGSFELFSSDDLEDEEEQRLLMQDQNSEEDAHKLQQQQQQQHVENLQPQKHREQDEQADEQQQEHWQQAKALQQRAEYHQCQMLLLEKRQLQLVRQCLVEHTHQSPLAFNVPAATSDGTIPLSSISQQLNNVRSIPMQQQHVHKHRRLAVAESSTDEAALAALAPQRPDVPESAVLAAPGRNWRSSAAADSCQSASTELVEW